MRAKTYKYGKGFPNKNRRKWNKAKQKIRGGYKQYSTIRHHKRK